MELNEFMREKHRWLKTALVGVALLMGLARISDAATPLPTDLDERADVLLGEFALSAEELDALVGKTATLDLGSEVLENATVSEVKRGRTNNHIQLIAVTPANAQRTRRLTARDLVSLKWADRVYRQVGLTDGRSFVLEDVAKRRLAAVQRLDKSGRGKFWPERTPQQQQADVVALRNQVKQVQRQFQDLELYETDYFFFLTDVPPDAILPYVATLDAVSESLGAEFGVPPGKNIWLGKCVIAAFVEREDYNEFELNLRNQKFFPARSGGGVCMSRGDGRVVILCNAGRDLKGFPSLVIHEMTHGFVHRYKTTAGIPSWLNEGMATWAGSVLGATEDPIKSPRHKESVNDLTKWGSFRGQLFEAPGIPGHFYGSAAAIVHLLMYRSPHNFPIFIDGIKEGYTWQESLDRAYGITADELCQRYGEEIGIPDLTP